MSLADEKKKVRTKNICAVATCPNPQSARYHKFPKTSALSSKWLAFTKRADFVNVATAKICSTHFKEDDYQEDMLSNLYPSLKRRLDPKAMPSIFDSSSSPSPTKVARLERAQSRSRKKTEGKQKLDPLLRFAFYPLQQITRQNKIIGNIITHSKKKLLMTMCMYLFACSFF